MQRGVYFDGWFAGQHNYHPSLPPRRLQMIDDLEDMRATMLVWSALGGGSISLPYLEGEADGDVPERFRTYGFLTDREFIAEAQTRGIDVFGIVFECQGWEFPAEIVDGEVRALNELGTTKERNAWVGLREFSNDTGPKHWQPFRTYFPSGLINSAGEQVTDLWEEAACRDLAGNALVADWVEVDELPQQNHYMDRNNPVWREYLKAIIRIQIDAGVAGVQLDEADTPLGAFRYGGCFCKDCVSQFRDYLKRVAPTANDKALDELDLDTFDYADWLRKQGFQAGHLVTELPLYPYFAQFNVEAVAATFKELGDYAHEYGRSVGREVKVAGNFYNCFGEHDPMVDQTDVLIAEMQFTGRRQPWWFRHAHAFARGRDVVIVENPYGGVIPELADDLAAGKGRDQFRLSIYEGTAMGAGMSLPYGAWMGAKIKNSYTAPKELADETGQFLEQIDHLRLRESANSLAVLYPLADNLRHELSGVKWNDLAFADDDDSPAETTAYWSTVEQLDNAAQSYDSVIVPDERLRANDLTVERLLQYRAIVLPGCESLSSEQHSAVRGYLDAGGTAYVVGGYGAGSASAAEVLEHPNTTILSSVTELARIESDVTISDSRNVSLSLAKVGDHSLAVHLVNYDLDENGQSVARTDIQLTTRGTFVTATAHRPGSEQITLDLINSDGTTSIMLPSVHTYAVLHLEGTNA